MPVIRLETFIHAPVAVCFDLSRDVEVHMASTAETGERAVAGVTSGMMELNDEVTWEAKHLGVRQRLTSRITALERPRMFVDEMQRGAFKSLRHLHLFEEKNGGTLMKDELTYVSPLGVLGRVADRLFLEKHMRGFLLKHNEYIKRVAEEKARGETAS
ncbi:MAG TPA: SRPBCC family protein [Pyrinomonadaceae bacterium]|jgi:ligand-binding SRPBCC domain-containing protein